MRKILFWLGIIAIFIFILFIWDIFRTAFIKRVPEYGSLILLDKEWQIITDKWKIGWYMIPYTWSLNTPIVDAIIAIEDNRYWEHGGIDLYGKMWSVWENIRAWWIVRGGSTITEQYIKNLYYPWAKRTIVQKLREAIMAIIIENTELKEDILRGYLNWIYFWNSLYWLASLEHKYYEWKELNEDDILDSITRINIPNIHKENKDRVLAYREKIQRRLSIWTEETGLFKEYKRDSIDRYPLVTQHVQNALTHFCIWETEELMKWTERINVDICSSPNQEIRLTIDRDLMEYSRIALKTTLDPIGNKNVTNWAIYIYNPTRKKVLAYIANTQDSRGKESAIDMIQERRSVWSILKPFVYLLALENGYDSNDFILDDTKVYPTGYDNKWFVPLNYTEKPYWPVRLREALWNSLNSSTVRLTEELGIGHVYDFFKKNNLDLNHDASYYGYGISLWWVELTLQNIVESYENLIPLNDPNLYLLQDILKDPNNRSRTFGISSILNTSLPIPVKTGTSTEFRDNWTVSYTEDAIIWIWVGNSDASPMIDVSGVSWAWPLWHTVAEYMISRGFIKNNETIPPSPLRVLEICLDRKCYQKELKLSKKERSPKSRPIQGIYYESEFITQMTDEEMKKWKIIRE